MSAQPEQPSSAAAIGRLSPELGNATRLAILAGLRGRERAEFKLVKSSLGLSDSVLSRHMTSLESAGLVEVQKGFVGRRPRTWLAITTHGREVLSTHLAALRAIAESDFEAAE